MAQACAGVTVLDMPADPQDPSSLVGHPPSRGSRWAVWTAEWGSSGAPAVSGVSCPALNPESRAAVPGAQVSSLQFPVVHLPPWSVTSDHTHPLVPGGPGCWSTCPTHLSHPSRPRVDGVAWRAGRTRGWRPLERRPLPSRHLLLCLHGRVSPVIKTHCEHRSPPRSGDSGRVCAVLLAKGRGRLTNETDITPCVVLSVGAT